jgi:hypothetical protein
VERPWLGSERGRSNPPLQFPCRLTAADTAALKRRPQLCRNKPFENVVSLRPSYTGHDRVPTGSCFPICHARSSGGIKCKGFSPANARTQLDAP